MRIFEGEGPNPVDVTFTYNANFFLFTTLEIARPIAHGRMQPPMPQVPVLTGMPVSGMAYLDRPSYAGYFIFPDLSVRHEGRYRLSFNLYEETKDAADADAESANEQQVKSPVPSVPSPDSSFDWRIEIKSAEFTVYSAKKFPGLAESTGLSKLVAEQGCRVRIRRDVRMRRRDGKHNPEYEGSMEDEYARAGRAPSVQEYRERSRSLSNESAERMAYPGVDRRTSGEYPRPYPSSASRPQSYLTFGGSAGNQYQAPPPRFAPPAPPAPPSYLAHRAPQPHPVQYRQPAVPPQDAYNRPPHSIPAQPHPPRDQYESKPQHPPESLNHGRVWQNGPELDSTANIPARGHLLPPMMCLTPKEVKEASKMPLTPIDQATGVPLDTAHREHSEPNHSFPSRVLPLPAPPPPPPALPAVATPPPSNTLNKRTHQAAFDPKSRAQDAPLYNGMRPGDVGKGEDKTDAKSVSSDEDDEEPAYVSNMTYRRANGAVHRVLNPPRL